MSNVFALTKVLIKNNVFAFSGRKKKGKEVSTKGSIIGFFLLIIFCSAFIGGPIIWVLSDILKSYNIGELIISFVLPLGAITSIIFGIFSIISVFYFNKDSESLLPLPIKSSELLMAKFFASLISEYLILIMFIFPILLGVGIGSGASWLFYVYTLLIFILMPIIPSVIVSIILMLANKVFKFGKKKDFFMYIMTGFILLFSFAYSFGLEFFMDTENPNLLVLLSGDFGEYLKISRYLFPPFNSASYSLLHCDEFIGFASFMTFIALNILSLVILYFLGDKLYIKGLTINNGSKQGKKESVTSYYRENKGGVMTSLIKKEWLTIKRSPVFMLNVVIANLIFPFVFAISFVVGFSEGGEGMDSLINLIDYKNGGVLLICIGILLILSTMSCATSSAISREGSSAKIMKTIPVSLKKQMDAKVYFSMIVDLIILFALELVIFIVFKTPWYYTFLVNIPLVLIMLITNYLSLILDLRRPRLDWQEESEAVKQNFNVFLGMMVTLVLSILFIVIGVLLFKSKVNIYLLFVIVSVLSLLGYLVMGYFIKKNESKLFDRVG